MNDGTLDRERLTVIAARADAATSGPWTPMLEGRDHSSGSSCIRTSTGGIEFDGASDADIEFMAHAREDVPYLISELRRLAEMLKPVRQGDHAGLLVRHYSRVRLLVDKYSKEGVGIGAFGYVIEIYADNKYEVEFSDETGATVAQLVLDGPEISLVL